MDSQEESRLARGCRGLRSLSAALRGAGIDLAALFRRRRPGLSPAQAAPPNQPQPRRLQKAKETPRTVPAVPVPTVAPNLLDQPAVPATVTAGNNELTVKANNSSLAQILHQVSSKTGMQLDGLGGDERVFGKFGPAVPREVLTALLNGTSYNVVMVGDLPNGAPRELLLTRRAGSGVGTAARHGAEPESESRAERTHAANGQNAQNGDDSAADDTAATVTTPRTTARLRCSTRHPR